MEKNTVIRNIKGKWKSKENRPPSTGKLESNAMFVCHFFVLWENCLFSAIGKTFSFGERERENLIKLCIENFATGAHN